MRTLKLIFKEVKIDYFNKCIELFPKKVNKVTLPLVELNILIEELILLRQILNMKRDANG